MCSPVPVGEVGDIVNPGDFLGNRKKVRQDYEERVLSILEGRKGRGKFGRKVKNPEAPTYSLKTTLWPLRNSVSNVSKNPKRPRTAGVLNTHTRFVQDRHIRVIVSLVS